MNFLYKNCGRFGFCAGKLRACQGRGCAHGVVGPIRAGVESSRTPQGHKRATDIQDKVLLRILWVLSYRWSDRSSKNPAGGRESRWEFSSLDSVVMVLWSGGRLLWMSDCFRYWEIWILRFDRNYIEMRAVVALLLNFNVALFFAAGHSVYQVIFFLLL